MKKIKKILIFTFITVLGLLSFVLPLTVSAQWEDTNNNPVLTTEWEQYKVAPYSRINTYQDYFIVSYNISLADINNKVLVFNKYSVLDYWGVFGGGQNEILIEYTNKPSVLRKTGYYINSNTMTETEKEEAYNRFFNSQFLFMNEDLDGVSKITLTLWLNSNGFSKSPPDYLELDYYNDIVYLIPINELPALNSFNLKSMKFYFKDFVTWLGSGFYVFDFSHIPNSYDYFIFNFDNNVSRTLYYGIDLDKTLNINTDIGIRLVDRNNLHWKIKFTSSFNNEDNYFIAYDYNYIINLKDSLSRDVLDAYNTGYNNGYDNGFIDGGNEGMLEGYLSGYDEGYYNGYDQGINVVSDLSFYSLISQVFSGIGTFLAIELLPNITFGAIFAVPLVFGIIFFIIGKRGGKDD